MRQPLMISCCICRRFKSSKSVDKSKAKQAIIRSRYEDKLLFGNLLESTTVKRKRLQQYNDDDSKLTDTNVTLRRTREKDSNEVTRVKNVSQSTHIASFLSFPFLNSNKDKYVVDGNCEEKCIKKLSNYHADYKSVSEILNKSMSLQSEANLTLWKSTMESKIGAEGFESYMKNQMSLGSMFRSNIISYLKGVPENKLNINEELKTYWSSAKTIFPVIPNIVESEGLVAHQDLQYKGIFDCLAVFRNEVMLVSWKKSDKYVSSLERTFDIPLQIAAYMGALNFDDRYPFGVEQALLVIAYSDGSKADLFHLNKEKCISYWKQWLERLNTYLIRGQEKNNKNISNPRDVAKNAPEAEISNEVPEKVDVDKELKEMTDKPRLIIATKENKKEEGYLIHYPLSNTEKPNFDAALSSSIKASDEYENSYPSVSSILSETKSEGAKFVLERWKRKLIEKLGIEGFEKYEKEMKESGSALHELIRSHLHGGSDVETEIPKNIKGFWQSLSGVLPLVNNVQATECTVAHPVCKYRGIIDCIALFQNKLVLIDWKTSEKMKTNISTTYDAPLQIAAYIGAVNFDPSYPFKVEEGLLVYAYGDGTKSDIFHLNKEKCLKYWKLWLERLHKYQTMAYEDGTKIKY